MISDQLLILVTIAVALVAILLFADDGMATCQATHSFDVCHDALN
jgi:hypothetical protein